MYCHITNVKSTIDIVSKSMSKNVGNCLKMMSNTILHHVQLWKANYVTWAFKMNTAAGTKALQLGIKTVLLMSSHR